MHTKNSDGAMMQNWRATASPERSQAGSESSSAGGEIGRLLLLGLVVGIGTIFVKQIPDMRRYLNMRRM